MTIFCISISEEGGGNGLRKGKGKAGTNSKKPEMHE